MIFVISEHPALILGLHRGVWAAVSVQAVWVRKVRNRNQRNTKAVTSNNTKNIFRSQRIGVTKGCFNFFSTPISCSSERSCDSVTSGIPLPFLLPLFAFRLPLLIWFVGFASVRRCRILPLKERRESGLNEEWRASITCLPYLFNKTTLLYLTTFKDTEY